MSKVELFITYSVALFTTVTFLMAWMSVRIGRSQAENPIRAFKRLGLKDGNVILLKTNQNLSRQHIQKLCEGMKRAAGLLDKHFYFLNLRPNEDLECLSEANMREAGWAPVERETYWRNEHMKRGKTTQDLRDKVSELEEQLEDHQEEDAVKATKRDCWTKADGTVINLSRMTTFHLTNIKKQFDSLPHAMWTHAARYGCAGYHEICAEITIRENPHRTDSPSS